MKKFFFYLFSILLVFSCKKKDSPPPDPYTYDAEVQSSQDISYACHTVSDLFALSCILSSSQDLFYSDHYFMPSPVSTKTVALMYNIQTRKASSSFDSTECKDGKSRAGNARTNFDYVERIDDYEERKFLVSGFESHLRLTNYRVDDWNISLADTSVSLQVNKINLNSFSLRWEMKGRVRMTHITDASRNLLFDISLVETAENPASFYQPPSGSPWNTAKIRHFGTLTGTRGNEQFTYTINHNDPLVRDMSCAVAVPGKPSASSFHPFTSGSSELIIGTKHPRTINHGVDGGCNNTGNLRFAEETYPLTFY